MMIPIPIKMETSAKRITCRSALSLLGSDGNDHIFSGILKDIKPHFTELEQNGDGMLTKEKSN